MSPETKDRLIDFRQKAEDLIKDFGVNETRLYSLLDEALELGTFDEVREVYNDITVN